MVNASEIGQDLGLLYSKIFGKLLFNFILIINKNYINFISSNPIEPTISEDSQIYLYWNRNK